MKPWKYGDPMKWREANGNGCGARALGPPMPGAGSWQRGAWRRPAPHFPDAKPRAQRAELVGEWRGRAGAQRSACLTWCPPASISQGVFHLVCALSEDGSRCSEQWTLWSDSCTVTLPLETNRAPSPKRKHGYPETPNGLPPTGKRWRKQKERVASLGCIPFPATRGSNRKDVC